MATAMLMMATGWTMTAATDKDGHTMMLPHASTCILAPTFAYGYH